MSKSVISGRAERLAALARTLKELRRQETLDDVLIFVLGRMKTMLRGERGGVFLFDENKEHSRHSLIPGTGEVTLDSDDGDTAADFYPVTGWSVNLIPKIGANGLFNDDGGITHLEGMRKIVCLPMTTASGVLGLVYLSCVESDEMFTEEEFYFAEIFAIYAGSEIETRKNAGMTLPTPTPPINSSLASVGLTGSSRAVEELRAAINIAAKSSIDVLIVGESGTGKELVARCIHSLGRRPDEPFASVNCSALPEQLLESELFGIEKGTATGVDKRIGLFERAGEGTVFLDEVGAMNLNTQAKLLRVLQEKRFCRVGGDYGAPISLKARVVSATNADLTGAIAKGTFREDLYYRLNVYLIQCPPLRERLEDIPELVDAFVDRHYRGGARRRPRLAAGVLDALQAYSWPGNARELENYVRVALAKTGGRVIHLVDFPSYLIVAVETEVGAFKKTLGESLDAIERELIVAALRDCNWVKTRAARSLGVSETNLRYRMNKHNVTAESLPEEP